MRKLPRIGLVLRAEQVPELSDDFILRTVKNQESYRGQNQHDYEMISIEFQNYKPLLFWEWSKPWETWFIKADLFVVWLAPQGRRYCLNDDEEFSKDLIEKIVDSTA